jgi:cell division septation protein DedD
MQDIDFSRYYRRPRRSLADSEAASSKAKIPPVNKLSLYLAIAFSSLAIGFIGGTQLQKNKMTREIEGRVVPETVSTNRIANTAPDAEHVNDTVHTTHSENIDTNAEPRSSYLILAKIFPDEKEASLAGLGLKRGGLKAFMARNGKKVKLYVGPIEGKTEAYDVLAKLKKNSEFSGAILYKK